MKLTGVKLGNTQGARISQFALCNIAIVC